MKSCIWQGRSWLELAWMLVSGGCKVKDQEIHVRKLRILTIFSIQRGSHGRIYHLIKHFSNIRWQNTNVCLLSLRATTPLLQAVSTDEHIDTVATHVWRKQKASIPVVPQFSSVRSYCILLRGFCLFFKMIFVFCKTVLLMVSLRVRTIFCPLPDILIWNIMFSI